MATVAGRPAPATPPPLPVAELVSRVNPLAVLGGLEDVAVTSVTHRHDEVEPGALFCCLPGAHADGHAYAAEARRRGAVAFLCEHSLSGVGGTQLVVGPGRARPAMAAAACALFRDPASAMATVGVTGTNGKTTVTQLLRDILERHGWPTGVVGTLDGARTTPEAPVLQQALAAQRDRGCRASALEVTSHALVQHRVDGICFDVAVFTNLSQDHLDYHHTMEAYFEAKAELFTPTRCRRAVVNVDDPYGRRLLDRAAVPTTGFSLREATELQAGLGGSSFRLFGWPVRLGLGGTVNVENAIAAAHAAQLLGVPEQTIAEALSDAGPVPGRFEILPAADGVTVVVDFAHTPAGLAQLLRATRPPAGRLVLVFGCGGDRDRGKRPAMGKVAGELADAVVITSDNPRSEDPAAIIEQVRAGLVAATPCTLQPDRREAIAEALRQARPGDVVVIAGKGHETTQEIGGSLLPFDDREVARQELARLGRGARRSAGGAARSA
jgi:UDP-N-acetylmuramoyl-L-alanyl-D-glutamate--2,6-diaminopimelate ligase